MAEEIKGELLEVSGFAEGLAYKAKMFVRPIIAISLTMLLGFLYVSKGSVPSDFITLYTGIMSFYFGESAGARQPGKNSQE